MDGIRVLDLGHYIAAPWCGQMLGDLGADVIKIEPTGTGDKMRRSGSIFVKDTAGRDTDLSSFLLSSNRNKRSLALDLRDAEDRHVLKQLIRRSDVMIENFKVGALQRFDLDYTGASKLNPRLIYCSISAFGQDGPWATRPGTDSLLQAMSGMMSITGEPDGRPQKVGVTIVDIMTGAYGATAILAALHHRDASGGSGQHIDLALFDTAMASMSHAAQEYLISGETPVRTGGVVGTSILAQVFETADGAINLQVHSDADFRHLAEILRNPELADDPRFVSAEARWANRADLLGIMRPLLAQADSQALTDALFSRGILAAPVLTIDRSFDHPQARHRGLRREARLADGTAVSLVANPIRFSATPIADFRAPPRLGEHNEDILREFCSAEDFDT